MRFHCSDTFQMLRMFSQARGGNVIVALAVAMIPLLVVVGAAVDYGRLVSLRTKAQTAADAAAIAVAAQPTLADSDVSAAALKWFLSNFSGAVGSEYRFSASRSGQGVVDVSFSMPVNNSFMKIVNRNSSTIGVKATAISATLVYMDIYLALDRSDSMLIADGAVAESQLKALTKSYMTADYLSWEPNGCVFACHAREGWEPLGKTVHDLAVENKIPLRDARLKNATAILLDKLLVPGAQNVRFGVVDFGNTANYSLQPTYDRTLIAAAIANGDARVATGLTNYASVGDVLLANIGSQGDGKSAASPKKVVIIVTDGLYTQWSETKSTWTDPFPVAVCDQIRSRGLGISVINTIYDPLADSRRYTEIVAPIASSIKQNLQACSDADMYFEANKAGPIEEAFTQLAARLNQQKIRLTK